MMNQPQLLVLKRKILVWKRASILALKRRLKLVRKRQNKFPVKVFNYTTVVYPRMRAILVAEQPRNVPLARMYCGFTQELSFFLRQPSKVSSFVFSYLTRLHMQAGLAASTQKALWSVFAQLQRRIGLQPSVEAALSAGIDVLPELKEINTLDCASQSVIAFLFPPILQGGFRWVAQPLPSERSFTRVRPAEELSAVVAKGLSLTYFVQHQALDRKLRKIVKNKYRYVRRYVYVRIRDRVRLGLRLCLVTCQLHSQRNWIDRTEAMLTEFIYSRETSLLYRVHLRHQQVALRALGLK